MGAQNYGCGKCPGEFICYECNTKECNTKTNYDKSFKCYESNGKLTSKRGIGCNTNKCYLAFDIKGTFFRYLCSLPPISSALLSSLIFYNKGERRNGHAGIDSSLLWYVL
uniref:Uncharacterized protein n=1 Tax=Meloidogyne enterolobii TaxID=390850 RepID=A0A6V7XY35_MELEN|nr:unnamed protein product [Meloidogyne enterolobii]